MDDKLRHAHKSIKIGFSGTAKTDFLQQRDLDLCKEIGAEVARQGAIMVTGATTGSPLWAARGAKEAGGFSIGLSPAKGEEDHVKNWGLPLDFMDVIIYTGFGFAGRDLIFTRATDGMVIGPGRIGTLHEFTIAFEDNKPIGVMHEPDSKTDDVIHFILNESHRKDDNKKVFFETDPKKLVAHLIELALVDKEGHL